MEKTIALLFNFPLVSVQKERKHFSSFLSGYRLFFVLSARSSFCFGYKHSQTADETICACVTVCNYVCLIMCSAGRHCAMASEVN